MQNLSLGVKIGFAVENSKILASTQKQLNQIGKSLDSYREKIDNFKGSLLEKVATAGALIAPIKVAIDFESSMAEVKKVTELSEGHSLQALSEDILNLSKKLPMAVDGIAALVAEGGKLGLASKEALKFGEVAASMGVAFEISAQEAGDNIGKMMASLGTNVEGIKNLGDSINYLADKGASDGKNLIEIISRMGGTAKVINLSENSISLIILGEFNITLSLPIKGEIPKLIISATLLPAVLPINSEIADNHNGATRINRPASIVPKTRLFDLIAKRTRG